jgi:hypothetical protein
VRRIAGIHDLHLLLAAPSLAEELLRDNFSRIAIYAQDRSSPGKRICQLVRNPDFSESNYHTTYSASRVEVGAGRAT